MGVSKLVYRYIFILGSWMNDWPTWPSLNVGPILNNNVNGSSMLTAEAVKEPHAVEKADIFTKTMLKPPLGSSGAKKHNCCVTWADDSAGGMNQAAEAVASGNFNAIDAASDTGIIILLRPSDANEEEPVEGAQCADQPEPETAPLRWPKRPGISDSDMLDPEESWIDTPPEGFCLTLSLIN
ncbi:hypothetical protein SLEP1_g13890 [Rubroshorea leprosula]|uniref:Uncharacterized protein n=1 Tax=Rubroshorea leprosula TaxID=152421 RepID=A0AAV5ISU3_9ROSI|nr:hypothetical protein SLEP1_g13890 [Rubroshorea leprosula]